MTTFTATPQMTRDMTIKDADQFLKATQDLYETWRACPTCHSGNSAARVLAAAHNGLPLSLHDTDRLGQDAKDLIRIAMEYGTYAADGVPIHWSEMDKVFEGLV